MNSEERRKIVGETINQVWKLLSEKPIEVALNAVMNSAILGYYKSGLSKEIFFKHMDEAWTFYAEQDKKDV